MAASPFPTGDMPVSRDHLLISAVRVNDKLLVLPSRLPLPRALFRHLERFTLTLGIEHR